MNLPVSFNVTRGQKVKIVLRPETLSMSPQESDSYENFVKGRIVSSTFVGSTVECDVLTKNNTLMRVLVPNPVEKRIPEPNTETVLYFSSRSLWLIPQ